MSPFKIVVVDDEPLAREGLRDLIEKDPAFEAAAFCGGGQEAIAAVRRHRPDLLLLDVQMPEMDGFEVLRRLGPDTPRAVIFVTAYDEFAIRAFEINALDYILKPLDAGRFSAALARARERLSRDGMDRISERIEEILRGGRPGDGAPPAAIERLKIRSHGCVIWIPVDEVERIEAADYYALIHWNGKAHHLRESLSSLERRLGSAGFVRIHRSHLVRVDRIRRLESERNGDCHVVLDSGHRLPVGRSHASALRRILG